MRRYIAQQVAAEQRDAITRKVQEMEQDRCCKIVFGMAGSDNVAQRTVDAIRGKV